MQLPTDPERLASYYLYIGAAQTLTSIYDMMAEIQMFELDAIYPQDTVEFKAAADTIEALKILVAKKQNLMVKSAREHLE